MWMQTVFLTEKKEKSMKWKFWGRGTLVYLASILASLWFYGHSCQALTSDFYFSAIFEVVFVNVVYF